MKYDYLIVGAGLFGAVFAHEMKIRGKTCKVIDKRDHIGGNIYTEKRNGIQVHCYGAHIFHTSDKAVWDYVNRFAEFNNYINSPVARYGNELYNMPFNMNTFSRMWNVFTPQEAQEIIEAQREKEGIREPHNLEEQALKLVGRDVYEKLVKGYTEKQWGRDCRDLPAFIIRRLPLRFTYDNNYFNDRYQGIPIGGYTQIVEKLLEGIPVELGREYRTSVNEIPAELTGMPAGNQFLDEDTVPLPDISSFSNAVAFEMDGDIFANLVYTGMIDEYFGYCYGPLEYRSLRFETTELPDVDNYQGNAVVNYTERSVPYTRIIEHKHFEFGKDSYTGQEIKGTIITKEYPARWQQGIEPYYPVNNEKNAAVYAKYKLLAAEKRNIIFGGRLGMYQYFDMDKVIRAALNTARAV